MIRNIRHPSIFGRRDHLRRISSHSTVPENLGLDTFRSEQKLRKNIKY